jgi:hypothetical protein
LDPDLLVLLLIQSDLFPQLNPKFLVDPNYPENFQTELIEEKYDI